MIGTYEARQVAPKDPSKQPSIRSDRTHTIPFVHGGRGPHPGEEPALQNRPLVAGSLPHGSTVLGRLSLGAERLFCARPLLSITRRPELVD
jgi:hypothetical protein